MSNQSSQKKPTHFVAIGDLAKVTTKNLILDEPVLNKSKNGHSWTTSTGHYKLGTQKADFLFEGVEQQVWGISGKWPMNIPAEEQNMENIDGLQVCIPINSQETLKEPTANEDILKKFLKGVLWQKCWDSMQAFDEKNLIDGPAGSACTTAQKKKNPEYAMKPIFAYPEITNEKTKTKTPDTSKSERMYVPLVTMGKGLKMKCLTPIYGPGNKTVNFLKYMSTTDNPIIGTIHPVYRWTGVFWGAHGKNTHGGSCKIEIVEMNFTPRKAASLSYGRMLSANTNVEEKEGSDSGEAGDASFPHPSGSGIVKDDFAPPGKDEKSDEKEKELMGSDAEGSNTDGEDDEEAERLRAEEEAKKKAKEAAIAKKKAMAAKRNAAKKAT